MIERTKVSFDSGGVQCVGHLRHPARVRGAALRSDHWRNEIAPRALLEMMRYEPGDVAQRLAMPLQVCIAEDDREAPPELARELTYRAPHAEVKSYPVAHFDFYREDVRARVLDDQLAFLLRHLMATRSSTEPTT